MPRQNSSSYQLSQEKTMPFQVDERSVKSAEETLGVKFPLSYREKMKRHNGGEIYVDSECWTLYPFFDSSDKKRIKRTANHIIHETQQAKSWAGFPESAIAIAGNGSGDQLIFIRAEGNPSILTESIYMWSHEARETTKIANDFNELQTI